MNRERAEGYLAVAAVGVLAGIAVAYARMPLHLPGHKALWWIAPVLAARLITARSAGASVGALATITTALLLGGRLAGGAIGAPLVILAGIILDVAAASASPLPLWRWLLTLSCAAAAANLVCFLKRLAEPAGSFFSTTNLTELAWAALCYTIFGFAAGILGTALAMAVMSRRAGRGAEA